jgi:hypothetical protein
LRALKELAGLHPNFILASPARVSGAVAATHASTRVGSSSTGGSSGGT